MRRTGVVLFVVVMCLMLVGCGFGVKNTEGLRAAYEKIELAYPLVIEIDARQDLKGKDKQALVDSYNEAKASINSFLEEVKTKSVKVVDVPKETFEKARKSGANCRRSSAFPSWPTLSMSARPETCRMATARRCYVPSRLFLRMRPSSICLVTTSSNPRCRAPGN